MNWIKKKWSAVNIAFLLQHLPDWCTGRADELEKRLKLRYGEHYSKSRIGEEKEWLLRQYIVALFMMVLLLSVTGVQWQRQQAEFTEQLKRPAYGEATDYLNTRITAEYQGTSVKKNVTLRIRPQMLSDHELQKRLTDCSARMKAYILAENKDAHHVNTGLRLPKREERSGVNIDWSSEPAGLVSQTGELNYIAIQKPQWVTMKAELSLGQQHLNAEYQLRLLPAKEKEAYEEALAQQIQQVGKSISAGTYGEAIELPRVGNNGIRFSWKRAVPYTGTWILLLTTLVIAALFRSRYQRIDREILQYRERLRKEFPGVVTELVLLLNAGLVVTEAFCRIGGGNPDSEKNTLEQEFHNLCQRISMSNGSLSKELLAFTRRTGVRELIRLATIINDNLDKGSELSEKLEAESRLVWMNRKKGAEEEGRKMEVKLTMPLVLLLLIVVLITIAPIFLEM